ncbi:hypothetical protein BBP40_004759 [Aspergillus hancockii]|nr:hypothetical protein BBP40_004759 [Aspergillus hancockii]
MKLCHSPLALAILGTVASPSKSFGHRATIAAREASSAHSPHLFSIAKLPPKGHSTTFVTSTGSAAADAGHSSKPSVDPSDTPAVSTAIPTATTTSTATSSVTSATITTTSTTTAIATTVAFITSTITNTALTTVTATATLFTTTIVTSTDTSTVTSTATSHVIATLTSTATSVAISVTTSTVTATAITMDPPIPSVDPVLRLSLPLSAAFSTPPSPPTSAAPLSQQEVPLLRRQLLYLTRLLTLIVGALMPIEFN